jgi:tetratricopeptide (TPR) repeat protein
MLSLWIPVHETAPYAVHRTIEGAAEVEMEFGCRTKRIAGLRAMAVLGALVTAGCWVHAQAPAASQTEQKPDQKQDQTKTPQKPAANPPAQANPFPEDTNSVPVLPSASAPALPPSSATEEAPPLPQNDVDPVRSPDEPLPDMAPSSSGGSSSSADLAGILAPPPDEDTGKPRKGKNLPEPEHKETAQEDESVGSYYLDQRNWRAALSRYQSALVLDPDNPDVYWGLAESQRHLGDAANAKSNYMKVVEYDPDSKHAKDAKKLLKDPEMANAPARPGSR